MRSRLSRYLTLFFVIFYILSPTNGFSLIKLNVETLLKNYIDEGLVLSTEFNSSVVIEEGVESTFRLGDKLEFNILINFEKDILNSGPSDLVSISGSLAYLSSYKKIVFELDVRKLRLGNKEAFYIQIEKDKQLEVYFKPSIKGFYIGN